MTAQTIVDQTTTEIGTQVTTQNTRATNAISDAQQFLISLTNAALYGSFTIPPLTPKNIFITSPLLTAIAPERPTTKIDSIRATIPAQPGNFTVAGTNRAMQSSPQEQFSSPVINFPFAPIFTEEVKPDKTEIDLPTAVTKPTPTIPGAVIVSEDVTPNIPSISLPNFGEAIPTISIALPETTLAYVEPVYTSTLKTELTSNLLNKIQNGGTGLNATIEGNIWNRDVERLAQLLDDNITDTLNRFSGRGFTMPPGTVAAQVQELQINHTNERAKQSRDIAIKQAEIADKNTLAFLEMGSTWEQALISHANNIANRALEAEKSIVEFGIASFNAKITRFNVELARYQAKDMEVQSNIRIQALKLDQYKAELQGVEVETNRDRVRIENYRAKLTAHDSQVRLYEAEVSAAAIALNIERAKIEIFKANIDDYVARIGAKKSEYDLYLAEIQGEKAKIDLYQANVAAYSARVDAVKISNSVVIEQMRQDLAEDELRLKAYLANVEMWRQKVQLAVTELGLEQAFYGQDIGKYSEEVKRETAQAELNIETLVKGAQLEQSNAEIQLQTAIANTNILIEQAKTKIAAAKGASDGYVTLASVAAGVIQTMLQLGGQGSSVVTATEA